MILEDLSSLERIILRSEKHFSIYGELPKEANFRKGPIRTFRSNNANRASTTGAPRFKAGESLMSTSQLSEDDQATILAAAKTGQPVSEALQKKLFEHVKAGHRSIFATDPAYDPNYLCCNTGQSPPDTYQWTTFDDCRMMGGTAAPNSDCGH